MKRLPLLLTLFALIFLAVSATYWGMQLYTRQDRPIAPAPLASLPEPSPDAAATLFGGQPATDVASNYQLTGIVFAGRNSAAILVAEGQPPKAVKVGGQVTPGVSISEVHPRYVMLSEGGVMRRVDLMADTRPAIPLSGGPSAPPASGAPMQQMEQMQQMQQAQPMQQMQPMPPQAVAPAGAMPTTEPQTAPGAVQQGGHVQLNGAPPPGEVNPVVQQGQEPPPEGPPSDVAPPPNQPQMPPPTRSVGSPVSDQPVSQ